MDDRVVMWVLCCIVTFVCCYLVNETFHSAFLTIGLAVLMGASSGVFCAVDARKQWEADGKD